MVCKTCSVNRLHPHPSALRCFFPCNQVSNCSGAERVERLVLVTMRCLLSWLSIITTHFYCMAGSLGRGMVFPPSPILWQQSHLVFVKKIIIICFRIKTHPLRYQSSLYRIAALFILERLGSKGFLKPTENLIVTYFGFFL